MSEFALYLVLLFFFLGDVFMELFLSGNVVGSRTIAAVDSSMS